MLLPYLWLPLRSAADPYLDWGNPDSLQGVLTHFLRRQYGGKATVFGHWSIPLLVTQLGVIADYLAIKYVAGSGQLAIFCGALVGGGLGFLWFNTYPAQLFMGDVGSLALGGALGAIAIVIRQEILLAVVGGIFVVETLSVMIQVISFRLTGKRVFLMAPIHHHFEQIGWAEQKIVVRFWIIAIILALVALSSLKLR